MSFQKILLSNLLVNLESGSRPKGGVDEDGDIPSLGAEHLDDDGGFKFKKIKKIKKEFFDNMRTGHIKKNDILIVKDGATTGKVSIVNDSFPFVNASVNEHVFILRVNQNISRPEYVFNFLKTKSGKDQILKDFRGATVGGISRTFTDKIEIPLPPLSEQKLIASILEKANEIKAKRELALAKLDELAQSNFIDIFGESFKNTKGWEKVELNKFGAISTGNTPPRANSKNYDEKFIEWIKTDNILEKSIYVTSAKEHLSQQGAIIGRVVKKDALLVACIAGSLDSIGRASLTDRVVAFNQQINAIEPNEDVNPLFLYSLFKVSRVYLQSHATSGMKKLLSKGDFEKIEMIKPPIALQDKFAADLKIINNLRDKFMESIVQINLLVNSLQNQAFTTGFHS